MQLLKILNLIKINKKNNMNFKVQIMIEILKIKI